MDPDIDDTTLSLTTADTWVRLAIDNIHCEYPHMPWIYATSAERYRSHRERHPAFYGSFDWHSCVEMYWVVARLVRLFPALPCREAALADVTAILSAENLGTELAYVRDPRHRGFERPYGWGWYLRLWHETGLCAATATWQPILTPLAEHFLDRFAEWLPKLAYPQRFGMHANTAFALNLAWPAIATLRPDLIALVRERAITWFGNDVAYPFAYEPSGADFLSGGLTEAVLMRRVLEDDAFAGWADRFLPADGVIFPGPAVITDESDGQLAHLHGLNLNRAWSMGVLIEALPGQAGALRQQRQAHLAASLPAVSGSHYMVSHWLVAFALLALTD